MSRFPRLLLDGTASDSQASDDGWALLAQRGCELTSERPDVVVLTGQPSPEARAAIEAGAGVLLLPGASYAGISFTADAATGVPVLADSSLADHADLFGRVDVNSLTAEGSLTVGDYAHTVLSLGGSPVVAVAHDRNTSVAATSVTEDPELLWSLVHHVAPHPGEAERTPTAIDKDNPTWRALKATVLELRELQIKDGSIPETAHHARADELTRTIVEKLEELSPSFPHDADYLQALGKDFARWSESGFGVPDFMDSLVAFTPAQQRRDGLPHLVVFPMTTQNGSPDRRVEAVLFQVIWPQFVAELEAGDYSNKLFVPIRFIDFTPGYDTFSAVLFPETVAVREVPVYTWGAIFADREAARFRKVVRDAAAITGLELPPDAQRLVDDQQLCEETFVMWDLIHDRTHMHGDLPFDPFMIKQRMPYFLYSLEELRCDLTAFREAVKLEAQGSGHARMVQYAVLFDRLFRFPVTGSRVRNYDGLGGQLLFAWLHQRRALNWTNNALSIDWAAVTQGVIELGEAIEELYWRSIDRPKMNHWLAAYALVSSVLEPHPSSVWAKGPEALPTSGPLKGLTDAVLDDEFPLSMFYEALSKKLAATIEATGGITG